MTTHDHLVRGAAATMIGDQPYGLVADAAIATTGDRISFVGRHDDFRDEARHVHRVGCVTPGLIDCHTHLVWGGSRAREFERRLQGATYEQIAREGGGILSTVRATRALDEDALVAAALPRLDALLAAGVTTVEIKSGYGLTTETELRLLRAARRLGERRAVDVFTTLLAAHAIPPELSADAYVDEICHRTTPDAVGLADAVDAFCEGIAFNPAQVARVFDAARAHGLPVKLHADQLSNQHGGALAARHGALSADHLEYLDQDGVDAMAAAGTIAVLLPGAYYFLKETQLPPVEALRRAGVPIALATDCNPGSSPIASPSVVMNMGCTLFRLTPEEALAGFTRHAARALGLHDRGGLAVGMRADLALWPVDHPAELAYAVGMHTPSAVMHAGRMRTP